MYRCFKNIDNDEHILLWKWKELADESIKLLVTSDNSLTPPLDYSCVRIRVKFDGQCLKQDSHLTIRI